MKTDREKTLEGMLKDISWMARRYADDRRTYAVGMYNNVIRKMLHLGIKPLVGGDKIIWARDGSGRVFDHLSEAEATPGTPEAMGENK